MTNIVLHTERLILRGPRADDLDDMFAVYSDPRAMRYWSTEPHADIAVTQDMLGRRLGAPPTPRRYFAIEMDGRFIGNAGNHAGDEIGFILNPQYWRRGIIREAMTAIIAHLWVTTDHAQLTADVDPRNIASCGVLRGLGFAETHTARRTFCVNGDWSDSVYFARPRPVA